MQLVPPMGVPCRGDHTGTLAIAGDLTIGEKSPVRGLAAVVSAGVLCRHVGPQCQWPVILQNFFYFAELIK